MVAGQGGGHARTGTGHAREAWRRDGQGPKSGVDLVVIDTRPSVEADAAQVAALSDFVLIPTRPAILDLRAILATLDIVKGSSLRAALVLNACQAPRGPATPRRRSMPGTR